MTKACGYKNDKKLINEWEDNMKLKKLFEVLMRLLVTHGNMNVKIHGDGIVRSIRYDSNDNSVHLFDEH